MNSIVPIDSGGVMLSYKCNCRCRHCLYAAGPQWNDSLDLGDVGRIFQGLLQTTRYLRGFHLAGGEPFLDFERLLRIQRLATEFGIPVEYVETNAGWCTDEDIAIDMFEQLRDSGLRAVLISCSPFHAEGVPLDRVTNAIRAASGVFGTNGAIVWVQEFYRQLQRFDTGRTVRLQEYVDSVGEQSMELMVRSGYSLISGGRVGYELADFYDRHAPERCKGEHCLMELLESGHAHFDPYGNLIPAFCSGISLGDARDLPSLIRHFDITRLPLVQMLVERGPFALYEFASREFGYKALDEGYIGKCHLCVDVRRWLRRHTDEFPELQPAEFYEQL